MSDETVQPLPRKITSSHTLCADKSLSFHLTSGNLTGEERSLLPTNNNNGIVKNDIPEEFRSALKLYREKEYEQAVELLEQCCDYYPPAQYQLACMSYDGLGKTENHSLAVKMMKEIVETSSPNYSVLIPCAQYNIGRAYYEGFGVKQSDREAEKWWLLSVKDGDASGCIKAQSILAMFYSRRGEETTDFKKSHYWHQEATANGSIESQATLGVMYEFGLGVVKDKESSFKCFKSAAEKGNIFAMGNLALQYFRFKMFRNSLEVARKLVSLQDTAQLSRDTDCLEAYIKKGISLGLFLYGRCVEKGVIEQLLEDGEELGEQEPPVYWYSKAAIMEPDTAQYMQDLVSHNEI